MKKLITLFSILLFATFANADEIENETVILEGFSKEYPKYSGRGILIKNMNPAVQEIDYEELIKNGFHDLGYEIHIGKNSICEFESYRVMKKCDGECEYKFAFQAKIICD